MVVDIDDYGKTVETSTKQYLKKTNKALKDNLAELEEASQYFKEHYGDTDPDVLYEELEDRLR